MAVNLLRPVADVEDWVEVERKGTRMEDRPSTSALVEEVAAGGVGQVGRMG